MEGEDYYALLGIARDAGRSQVRRVWRQLALQWHPDRAGPAGTPMFQRISRAYAVLSDPAARADYDRRTPPPPRAAKAPRPRAPGVMLSRLTGPLNALMAQGTARRAEPGVIELFLNPQEAAEGGMITISMWVQVRGGGEELFSAWLAVPPGAADGELLAPSRNLRGMLEPVLFRVLHRPARR